MVFARFVIVGWGCILPWLIQNVGALAVPRVHLVNIESNVV
jgi:hypothetical protein